MIVTLLECGVVLSDLPQNNINISDFENAIRNAGELKDVMRAIIKFKNTYNHKEKNILLALVHYHGAKFTSGM